MKGISIKGITIAVICTLVSSHAMASPNVVGYFEAKPDIGGTRNRFCVKQLKDNRLEVQITTAYCPSKECMNARLDGMLFKTILKANSVSYTNQSGCNLKILFNNRGAKIIHNSDCRDGNHTYFYADGAYKFVKNEFDEQDCSH